ncbi:hypothetical protein [Gelidibacter salicanalis]|uniref:Sugar transporter n=1 Tax=Gelidibacter salicanalis TaxID=291193 RepID=A0A934NK79_9FLAO|nr:hypothetical protein [Gelidibacter salicanalis]MBJ7882869.1 hypothetical protein [Gelidibacter salicanalis]
MNFTSLNRPPVYFWIVSIIAFIWNAIGVYNYIALAFMTDDHLGELSKTEQHLPAWYLSVFAIAVFAGLFGSMFLLIRKRWAYVLFIVSFLAVGFQQFYILTEVNPRDIFLSLTILVISVFLIWFSKRAVARKWLK